MGLTEQQVEFVREILNAHNWLKKDTVNALCDAALAHLAASERSVQGWAMLDDDGTIMAVTAFHVSDEIIKRGDYQPVTITINAAGQEEISADTAPTPVPAATIVQLLQLGASIKRDHYYDEYVVELSPYPVQRAARIEDCLHGLLRLRSTSDPAPAAPVTKPSNLSQLLHRAIEEKPVAESDKMFLLAAARLKEGEAIGIRKGLEMAAQHFEKEGDQRFDVDGNWLAKNIRALLDAQKEGV